jgi:hypothetical protein
MKILNYKKTIDIYQQYLFGIKTISMGIAPGDFGRGHLLGYLIKVGELMRI